ncbi:hypothetical protein [Streptomyces sp. NPDC007264]|uniref:hypothetical protein n=1 Tax=Streptomyces sp. NPDC007264 TaxID=3364777 RepID=UPI0036DE5710
MSRSTGRLRRPAAPAWVSAVLLAVMVWGAPSAAAGGPTSVLVTSPRSAKATALYFSDKEYGQLLHLLGEPDTGTRDKPPGADPVHSRQINVTWLAHDFSPWRLDRVFPDGTGAVWIHTAANVPASLNGYWHRATDPARLRTLLEKLGVMGGTSDTGYSGIAPAPWQSAVPEAPNTSTSTGTRTAPPPAAATGAGGGTGWWWSIPGAVGGAVLALLLRPLVTGLPDRLRNRREPGPRQELRDV